MGSGYHYGKVRAETMQIIMEAALMARRDALWARLMPDIVTKFKDGDRLEQIESEWLEKWIDEQQREDLKPANVQTVQIPRDWVAKKLSGRDQSAERAIRHLQQIGLLKLIHKGIKGHASLYCVMPLPSSGLDPPNRIPPQKP